jgi:polysaccharide deacetylase family protein (PEP-CTERM system associated)
LERNTHKALELLDRFGIRATFFVMGWNADRYPEIVREVAARGHEIASTGYYHRRITQMTPEEYRQDLARAREALERAAGQRVVGYRVAHGWFSAADLWALDVLAEEGYAYDASINPSFGRFHGEETRRFLHQHRYQNKVLWEFPVSTADFLGLRVPIAGGNYYRQFPHWLLRRSVERWHKTCAAPFVMYFNVWELDPEQPKIAVASRLTRIRHYRNLHKMSRVLEDYFARYTFTGAADYLGLDRRNGEAQPDGTTSPGLHASGGDRTLCLLDSARLQSTEAAEAVNDGKTRATVVVPCYNEELILPYLCNTLRSVQAALGSRYDLNFIFVDDGSGDATWDSLGRIFGGWPEAKLLRHDHNRGVAAAILTGIRHADTEVVSSIDCDCTYDPHELGNLIRLLVPGVDLVTASPYHPQGRVRNVARWRLALSRGASFLYRRVLRQKLYTYTSCFRVYRKSAVVNLDVREHGYLGIAEMVARLDFQGSRIVEYPTTLEVRILGRSKIAVARTIIGHLRLLSGLLLQRMCGKVPPATYPFTSSRIPEASAKRARQPQETLV